MIAEVRKTDSPVSKAYPPGEYACINSNRKNEGFSGLS